MTEDGAPPPQTVTIERVCSGTSRAEGYTDSKGYFSIRLGDETGVFQDASETARYSAAGAASGSMPGMGLGGAPATGSARSSGATSDQRWATCDLRAQLTGYRSQTVSLVNRRPLDDPNIGIILLHREGRDEGSTISAVSLAAPRGARKAFEKGLDLLKKDKTDEAEKEYRKAIALYPHYADAWNELGRIQMERGQNDDARQSFDAAIQADPKYVNPYLQLSLIAVRERNWREVADLTDKAIRLDPFDYPRAYLFNGVAHWNLQHVDAAEKSIRQADKLDGQHTLPDVSHMMGMILMQRHDFSGAAEYLRRYLKLAPTAEEAGKARALLAQAEKLLAQNAPAAKQDQ
jgi:tetratricopeptide (TPR) repeat protein